MDGRVEYAFDVETLGCLSCGELLLSCSAAAGGAALDNVSLVSELLKKLVLRLLRSAGVGGILIGRR